MANNRNPSQPKTVTERSNLARIAPEDSGALKLRTEAGADDPTISVDSLYNLGSSRCVIEFEAGRVVSTTHE